MNTTFPLSGGGWSKKENLLSGSGSLILHITIFVSIMIFTGLQKKPLPPPPKEVKVVKIKPQPVDMKRQSSKVSMPKIAKSSNVQEMAKTLLKEMPTQQSMTAPSAMTVAPQSMTAPSAPTSQNVSGGPVVIGPMKMPTMSSGGPAGPLGGSGVLGSGAAGPGDPNVKSAGGPAIAGLKTYVGGGGPAMGGGPSTSKGVPGVVGGLGRVGSPGAGIGAGIGSGRKTSSPDMGGVDFGDINTKSVAKHDREMGVAYNDNGLRNFVASKGGRLTARAGRYNAALRGQTISISLPSIASMGGVASSSFEIFQDVKTAYANLAGEVARRTGMKVDVAKKVPLSDEKILDSPILVFDDIRAFALKFAEREMLTRYLDGNGLILINVRHYDTGEHGFMYHITYELRKILRDRFELKTIPKNDIIFNTFYDLTEGTVPSRWAASPLTGVYINDRLSIIVCRNSYTSSMADENIHHPTPSGRELAYQLHVNILVYAALRKMGKI